MRQCFAHNEDRAAQRGIISTLITTPKPIATHMNSEQPLGGIAQAPRTPWADFPDAVIHQSIPTVQGHPQYAAAKGGDVSAAQRLLDAVLNSEAVARIAVAMGGHPSILLPVYAEEAQGINRIPAVMAEALEALLPPSVPVRLVTEIVQTNRARHTGERLDAHRAPGHL